MTRRYRLAILAAATAIPSAAWAEPGDWSGFYVGLDAGAANADLEADSTDTVAQVTNVNPPGPQPITVVPSTTTQLNADDSRISFLYGATAGFLAQSGGLVFGLEADVHGPRDAGEVAQTNTIPQTLLSPSSTVTLTREAETQYDWSLRGKIGVAMRRTLLYATGGVVSARVELRAENVYTIPAGTAGSPSFATPAFGPIVTTAEESRTMTGWTGGIGAEQRLGNSLSVGLDLRYNDYGSKTFNLATSSTTSPPLIFTGAEGGTGNPLSPSPRATPGPTRIDLSEWRLVVRLLWRL